MKWEHEDLGLMGHRTTLSLHDVHCSVEEHCVEMEDPLLLEYRFSYFFVPNWAPPREQASSYL